MTLRDLTLAQTRKFQSKCKKAMRFSQIKKTFSNTPMTIETVWERAYSAGVRDTLAPLSEFPKKF